jgi:hypothetical protein
VRVPRGTGKITKQQNNNNNNNNPVNFYCDVIVIILVK